MASFIFHTVVLIFHTVVLIFHTVVYRLSQIKIGFITAYQKEFMPKHEVNESKQIDSKTVNT